MLRISCILLYFSLLSGQAIKDQCVELDVVFNDSTMRCLYLYVICVDNNELRDTLAIFDSLSFNRQDRVSLFYKANNLEKKIISFIDCQGVDTHSKPYGISAFSRNTPALFSVILANQQVTIVERDFFYLLKKENLATLIIFYISKLLIISLFVTFSTLPKRTAAIASGSFLLSMAIYLLFPFYFVFNILIIIPVEYLFIALIGKKYISWLWAAFLVLGANIISYGIVAFLYYFYYFY